MMTKYNLRIVAILFADSIIRVCYCSLLFIGQVNYLCNRKKKVLFPNMYTLKFVSDKGGMPRV